MQAATFIAAFTLSDKVERKAGLDEFHIIW